VAIKRKTRKPSVPRVVTKDGQLNKFTAAIHELMDIWAGNKNLNDKVVTFGDLVDSGGFSVNGVAGTTTGDSTLVFDGVTSVDTTPPAKVTGIIVDAGLTSIFISWTLLSQTNISHYEIWRNEVDNWDGNELRIGTSLTALYADAVGDTNKTYYYWVRGVNTAGIVGPVDATGLVGGTAAIVNTDFASSITPVEIFAVLPTTDNFTGRQVLLTTDKKLYRYNGTAWTNEVDGGDISSNSIVTGSIATGAIKAAQIDASAVTAGKIAAGSVTADRMNVTQLSAIAANLGSITGGSLSINGKFVVDSSGNTTIKSASSGQRLVMQNNVIKVYDSSGVKRVQIGDLTA